MQREHHEPGPVARSGKDRREHRDVEVARAGWGWERAGCCQEPEASCPGCSREGARWDVQDLVSRVAQQDAYGRGEQWRDDSDDGAQRCF